MRTQCIPCCVGRPRGCPYKVTQEHKQHAILMTFFSRRLLDNSLESSLYGKANIYFNSYSLSSFSCWKREVKDRRTFQDLNHVHILRTYICPSWTFNNQVSRKSGLKLIVTKLDFFLTNKHALSYNLETPSNTASLWAGLTASGP